MMRARELTLPLDGAALEAFMHFAACVVEAFALCAPAGAVRDAVEIAGKAFAGDEEAWPVLVRAIAVLLAFTRESDGATAELRAFVEENADLLRVFS
jgi:hypothetical protein